MAKREFIEQKRVITCLENTAKYYDMPQADEWTKGIHYGLLHGIDNILDNVPTVTEQEIVKPYLAKLKSEIYEKIDSANTGWADCRVDDIIEIIDNLLGQEQTNDN